MATSARLFRIALIFWFGGTSVEPDLRLSEVDVVIPDDSVPVGIGMGTPEDRLVLKGTEGLTLEERGTIVHLPLAILELDKQRLAGLRSNASDFWIGGNTSAVCG